MHCVMIGFHGSYIHCKERHHSHGPINHGLATPRYRLNDNK